MSVNKYIKIGKISTSDKNSNMSFLRNEFSKIFENFFYDDILVIFLNLSAWKCSQKYIQTKRDLQISSVSVRLIFIKKNKPDFQIEILQKSKICNF